MADNVNHPAHYKFSNGAEVIDLTENLSFNLGNVVKYVARAGRKTDDPTEDLLKAQFYLEREIGRLLGAPEESESPWSLTAVTEQLERLWGYRGLRQWDLLDHVPPNTIVMDRDGDQYRRINGTGKFQIRLWRGEDEWDEWQDLAPGLYFDHCQTLAPFREVKDG